MFRNKIEQYELEVINILCCNVIDNSTLIEILTNPEVIEVKFTGEGYYLDIKHNKVPMERKVCDKPTVIGNFQDQDIGFIAFIENNIITLECYNYTNKGIPETIRNGTVKIKTT